MTPRRLWSERFVGRAKLAACASVTPILTACASGCSQWSAFPIFALPWPEKGSGQTFQLHELAGEAIRKDGWLLLARQREDILSQEAELCELLEIRDGRVRLPDRWVLASVWIVNYFGLPLPYICPRFHIGLMPMVQGYHGYDEGARGPPLCLAATSPKDDFWHGSLTVFDSDASPLHATEYWRSLLSRFTGPENADLIEIADEDRTFAVTWIEQELARLEPYCGTALPRGVQIMRKSPPRLPATALNGAR
ncbi:MAG: hypothetical protein ACYSVY_08005 [Planctomycetota bacterium]|jgi:hypothetical protein